MNRTLLAAAVFISVIGCVGCASGYFGYLRVDTITLNHAETLGVNKLPDAGHILVDVQINDERRNPAGVSSDWNKAQVGHSTNGFGEPISPTIVVSEPVDITLKKAIEKELKLRGFNIGDKDGIKVEIDINRFYTEFKAPWYELVAEDVVADVVFIARIKSCKEIVLYSRRFDTKRKRKFVISPGSEEVRLALNSALDDGISSLFSDKSFTSALFKQCH